MLNTLLRVEDIDFGSSVNCVENQLEIGDELDRLLIGRCGRNGSVTDGVVFANTRIISVRYFSYLFKARKMHVRG